MCTGRIKCTGLSWRTARLPAGLDEGRSAGLPVCFASQLASQPYLGARQPTTEPSAFPLVCNILCFVTPCGSGPPQHISSVHANLFTIRYSGSTLGCTPLPASPSIHPSPLALFVVVVVLGCRPWSASASHHGRRPEPDTRCQRCAVERVALQGRRHRSRPPHDLLPCFFGHVEGASRQSV